MTKHHRPNFRTGKLKGISPQNQKTVAGKTAEKGVISDVELLRSITKQSEDHQLKFYQKLLEARLPKKVTKWQQLEESLAKIAKEILEQELRKEFENFLKNEFKPFLSTDEKKSVPVLSPEDMGEDLEEEEKNTELQEERIRILYEKLPIELLTKVLKNTAGKIAMAAMAVTALVVIDQLETTEQNNIAEQTAKIINDVLLKVLSAAPMILASMLRSRSAMVTSGNMAVAAGLTVALNAVPTEAKEAPKFSRRGGSAKKEVAATPVMSKEAFHFFWVHCATDTNLAEIDKILADAKENGTLRSLLNEVSQTKEGYKYSALEVAVNLGSHQAVKKILDAIKDDRKLLKETLMKIVNAANMQGQTLLTMAAYSGYDKVVEEILAPVKGDKKLFKEVATQRNAGDESVLSTALKRKKHLALKKLLDAAKDRPEYLEELTKQDAEGYAALHRACALPADNTETIEWDIETVNIILEAVQDNPALIKTILKQKNTKGSTPLHVASTTGNYKAVKKIFAIAKNVPGLSEEIVKQTDAEGVSPLYSAALHGADRAVVEILEAFKDNPELLKFLIKQRPANQFHLDLIDHLLMAGNDEAIEIILESGIDITIKNLPDKYFSNVPKTSIYYLEAFLNSSEEASSKLTKHESAKNTKASYFQLQDGKPKEVKIGDIKPSSDDPILIELSKLGKEPRRVILASDTSNFRDMTQEAQKFKRAIDFANNLEPKVNDIVMNTGFNFVGNAHAVTFKFSREKDNNWNVDIYDPDLSVHDVAYAAYVKFITEISKAAGIKTTITPKHKVRLIVPNHDKLSCDIVSSIVAGSVILGDTHTQHLKQQCSKKKTAVVELGKELNPQIDKANKRRLQRMIEPSKSPQAQETEKVAGQQHRTSRDEL
jgi:ankyrin repeat protein